MSVLAATSNPIGEALAQIASALRTPVLVLALLALLACALETGRFFMEAFARTRARRTSLQALTRQVLAEPARAELIAERAPSSFTAAVLLAVARVQITGEAAGVEHALADFELAVERRLDRTRILVRAGPALGLMGTLIPLAPGLAALGRGDVSTLAGDLRTAFAATTIGLLVGTVAFALTLTRTRFYSEDLTALERGLGAPAHSANGHTQTPLPLPDPTYEHAAGQGAPPTPSRERT
jgi:biopolymer transport protein ExbB/TolQ